MNLSNNARKNRTTGEIVNLMQVDIQRLQDMTTFVMLFWSAPLQVAPILLSRKITYHSELDRNPPSPVTGLPFDCVPVANPWRSSHRRSRHSNRHGSHQFVHICKNAEMSGESGPSASSNRILEIFLNTPSSLRNQ